MEPMKRIALLASARRMADMLHQWQVMDVPELTEDDGPDSVAHHQNAALKRVLGHLDLHDPEVFLQLLRQGESAQEALAAAMRSQRALTSTH